MYWLGFPISTQSREHEKPRVRDAIGGRTSFPSPCTQGEGWGGLMKTLTLLRDSRLL